MANFLTRISEWWAGRTTLPSNLYNAVAYQWLGGQTAQYDYDNITYLDKGYGFNPDVYAIVSQMADKTKAVPFYVKQIKDKNRKKELDGLRTATKGNATIQQKARMKILETKAFDEKEIDFPLEQPNPTQSWTEIWALYKVYIRLTGNAYLYMVSPTEGVNKGVPKQVYILPSHLVKIVIKDGAELLDDENPIGHYMLIEGNQYIRFNPEDIIHIKYPNPFFDLAGGHLYGLSPMRALLRNIESSNDALDHNVKTMKNSGVFGFITSADPNAPFTADQALQIKQKLVEMDNANGRLSKIAGSSAPIAFTKLSLNTDELKPFDFLKHDQKTICSVLNWPDELLNNDEGSKYDNIKEAKKTAITDNILPDLVLLAEALNKQFIPRFKNYQNCEIEWDITELPEMQEDYKMMVDWMHKAPLTPNEIRLALKYETLEDEGMNVVWIESGKKRIDEVGITDEEINKAFEI